MAGRIGGATRQGLRAALLALVAATALVGAARAESADRRVALVIGDGAYPDQNQPIPAVAGDVDLLAGELGRDGFEVDRLTDAGKDATRAAVAAYLAKITAGMTALVYFKGIGIQVAHQTYLIPVNAQIWSEADVRHEGVDLGNLLAEMHQHGAAVTVAIVDASRRNPFERRFRATSDGLASVDAPNGTLVVYAAAPNKIVSDRPGDTSIFMRELIDAIRKPDVSGEEAATQTRVSVARVSRGEEVPWVASSLFEPFAFRPGAPTVPPQAPQPPAPAVRVVETPAAPKPAAPPPPAPPEPPAQKPYCARGDDYDKVVQSYGVDELRLYLQRCSEGGPYKDDAAKEFESRLYLAAADCIRHTPGCDLDGCVGVYQTDLPSGARLGSLQDQARRQIASRAVCRPPDPDQTASLEPTPSPRAPDPVDRPGWCRYSRLKPTELAICGDALLSKLDGELTRVYNDKFGASVGAARGRLAGSEHDWVAQRDRRCGALSGGDMRTCLSEMMQSRIGVLLSQ